MSSPAPRTGRAPSRRRSVAALALLTVALASDLACGPGDPTDAEGAATTARPTVSATVPARAGDLLVDVTAEAGLDFRHLLLDGEMSNLAESLGAGAAALDADGDGLLDLYLVQGGFVEGLVETEAPDEPAVNRLYHNLGELRFQDVSEGSGADDSGFGLAVAVGDVDADGRPDLYLCNLGPNRLLRGLGELRFDDVSAEAGADDSRFSSGATFFDADADGDLDLYVTNYLTLDPDYDAFYAPDAFPPPMAYEAQADRLLLNRGDGSFEDGSASSGIGAVAERGMAVLASDLDGDGLSDVFVSNDGSANLLWHNLGGARFEDQASLAGVAWGVNGEATAAMTVDRGDCDGDGLDDLVVTDISYGSLYLGQGQGLFADEVMTSGLGAASGRYVTWGGGFLDVDDDADLDLFLVNGDLHHLVGWEDQLLLNDGAGLYGDAAARSAYLEQKLMGRGATLADLDNDGDIDVLVTNLADRPVLLRNDSAGDNAWLTVRLRPSATGATPYGALVTVVAGGRSQRRELRCPTTYLCSGDPRLHFGLGPVQRIDSLSVRWPGGTTQTLTDLAPRREIVLGGPES